MNATLGVIGADADVSGESDLHRRKRNAGELGAPCLTRRNRKRLRQRAGRDEVAGLQNVVVRIFGRAIDEVAKGGQRSAEHVLPGAAIHLHAVAKEHDGEVDEHF